eukprot:scaffold5.g622.t1
MRGNLAAARVLLERSRAQPSELIADLLAAAEVAGAAPACRDAVRTLLTDLTASRSLLSADWAALPSPCPGLACALPAVLARSPAEAAQLVAHLPPLAQSRLHMLALSLAHLQRRLDLELPEGVVRRILVAAPLAEEREEEELLAEWARRWWEELDEEASDWED